MSVLQLLLFCSSGLAYVFLRTFFELRVALASENLHFSHALQRQKLPSSQGAPAVSLPHCPLLLHGTGQTCATRSHVPAAAGTKQLWAAPGSPCARHMLPHRVPNVPLPAECQGTGFNILPLAGSKGQRNQWGLPKGRREG